MQSSRDVDYAERIMGARKRAARVGLLVAVATMGWSLAGGISLARADETITVKLKNGNLVRGELVERVNGDKVVLKLATGEVRTLAWADVEAPEQVGAAPPAAAPAAPPAPTPPPATNARPAAKPAPPVSAGVTVTLESNTPQTHLSVFEGSSTGTATSMRGSVSVDAQHFRYVCAAPCTKEVDPEQQYVVTGPDIKPSEPFSVSQGMKLRAEPVGSGRGLGGLALVAMGGGLGGMGIALGTIFLATEGSQNNDSRQSAGGAFLGVGVITALITLPIGIYLLATNQTKVFDAEGQRVAKPKVTPLRLGVRGVEF
jgi:hypothetical protein